VRSWRLYIAQPPITQGTAGAEIRWKFTIPVGAGETIEGALT
jgi:hypothetical protein